MINRFIARAARRRARYVDLIALGLLPSAYLLIAACIGVKASGFSGEFGESKWQDNCVMNVFTSCGRIDTGNDQLATVYPDDPLQPTTGTYTPGVNWLNSAGRASAYTISFNLDFYTDDPFLASYAYYSVGGSQVRLESDETTSLTNSKSLNVSAFSLAANEAFSFGLYIPESSSAFSADGEGSRLVISNFSATPYTPVTAPLVPAPLPAIGAASLFLGSRRLKKRMVRQRVLRLARRNLAPALRSVLPG